MAPKMLPLAATAAATVASGAAHADAGGAPSGEYPVEIPDGVDILPLSEVEQGQTGYGLTTMQGTEPEAFEFEVVGINRNFLPKMDLILVRSDDPKLEVSGFWRGMSGSPLFIDGKLACAFSYGYRFNQVAIGGCTPIEVMKREGFRTARRREGEAEPPPPDSAGAAPREDDDAEPSAAAPRGAEPARRVELTASRPADRAEWLDVAPERTVRSAMETLGAPREPWLMSTPLPEGPRRPVRGEGLEPAAVPLSLSGFTSPALSTAREIMSDYPVDPMQAGGTGDPDAGPREFSPGSSMAVQLIRGDMSAAATGTVSHIEGDRVLGFGHPLFQAGELYAPVAAAEVHTVIPSAMNAFVVASPLRELGALVQDRQSTIMASTGLRTQMIPMDIDIEARGGGASESGSFRVEVLNNRYMTGSLAGLATTNAISHYLPDQDHATATIESEIHLRGYEPLRFTDHVYARDGAESAVGGARGLRALVPLLMNPFEPVDIRRIALDIDVHYRANVGRIEEIRMPAHELPPGERVHAAVVLSRYDGARVVERVPFDVPEHLAGHIVQVQISAGDSASVDRAPPQNLGDLLDNLREQLPGDVFAVTINTAEEGAAVGGRLVRDMPASAMDRLSASAVSGQVSRFRPSAQSLAPTDLVIEGGEDTLIQVADR